MKAFAEHLVSIIRVGPACDGWEKDYEVAVVVVADGTECTIKALTRPTGGFTFAHKRAILLKVKELGLTPKWSHKRRQKGVPP